MASYRPSFAEAPPISADELDIREQFRDFYSQAKRHFEIAQKDCCNIVLDTRRRAAQFLKRRRSHYTSWSRKQAERMSRTAAIEIEITKEKERAALYKEVESECMKLAFEIAKQIIQKEVEGSTDYVREKIRQELSVFLDMGRVTIRTHPAESTAIEEYLIKTFDDHQFIVTADAGVKQGDAVLSSSRGTLELRWREDLKALEKVLQSKLEAHHDAKD